MDIQGVPYIVINNKFSITGCQNEEMLKKLFIDALENKLEITKSGLIKIADDGYSTPINNNDSKKDHGKVAVKRVLVHDVFDTNSYFYIDEKTNHGFLLDPGAEPDKLIRIIKNNNWTIEKILLTHGHFDHTGAVEELYNKLNIPYFVHEKGELYLKSTHYNLSRYCERNVILNDGQYFKNGKIFSLSSNPNVQLRVIHTPGHTPDSVVFYDEYNKLAFVGDTIFKDSIGTTRYFGGNDKDLKVSILEKIFKLPEDVTLLSGHSEKTTVGREKSLYMF
jgi:glyoxylase-like metal-dependent hydrolase (beta-lactamase superfamily II)